MPYQELPGLGMRGLNTDTPAQALDHTMFSDGNNMRPFDGSLQTVFATAIDINLRHSGHELILTSTQWLETGGTELRYAYIYRDSSDIYVQIINDLTTDTLVTGFNADTMTSVSNPRWGHQLFAFNNIMVFNDSVNQPIIIFYDETDSEYKSQYIAGWLSSPYDDLNAADQLLIDNASDIAPVVNSDLASSVVWNEGTNGWSSRTEFEQLNQALSGSRTTCERLIPYNGRLIALNVNGEYLGDELGNASIVWSTPIDELSSLNNVTFRFTSTNSAGDDILTETPGEVVDGGLCGQYLIIYKSDAVYRYADTGAPLYLVGETIYNDDGLFSPDCFADIGGGRHIMLGNFGVYLHDGGPNRQNISRNRIQSALYRDIYSFENSDKHNTKDNTFLFHHQNDKEVWICYPSVGTKTGDYVGCDKAYVYNYETDSWYTRDLPDNTTSIESILFEGELFILITTYGDNIHRLDDERMSDPKFLDGDIELHYLNFGDPSKVKHLYEIYPHSMEKVTVDIETTNNLGIRDAPDFTNDPNPQTFDANENNDYKIDYRTHGRYYHIHVSSAENDDGVINPQLTGMGFDMKIGGQR